MINKFRNSIHDIITKDINPFLNSFLEKISRKYTIPPERVIEGVYIYSKSNFPTESWLWEYIDEKRNFVLRKFEKTQITREIVEEIISYLFFSLYNVLRKEDQERLIECFNKIIRGIRGENVKLKIIVKPSRVLKKYVKIETKDKTIVELENQSITLQLVTGVYKLVTCRKFLVFKFYRKESFLFLLFDKTLEL